MFSKRKMAEKEAHHMCLSFAKSCLSKPIACNYPQIAVESGAYSYFFASFCICYNSYSLHGQ